MAPLRARIAPVLLVLALAPAGPAPLVAAQALVHQTIGPDLAPLRAAFDRDRADPRLLLILSPT